MKLVTSNLSKLAEYKRFGLTIEAEKGLDLPEVMGTPEEVITHKAIKAGEELLVEDTILIIDGKEVVDIKMRLNELHNYPDGISAQWMVSLGVVSNGLLKTCSATIRGTLKTPVTNPFAAFGFDAHFFPDDEPTKSLHLLELEGRKDEFSARKRCIEEFISKNGNYKEADVTLIPEWTGDYQ